MNTELRHVIMALVVTALSAVAACSPSDKVIARSDFGPITLEHFDDFLLTLPPAARNVPAANADAWIESQLRNFAMRQILLQSEQLATQKASPEHQARELFERVTLLGSLVAQDISQEVTIDDAKVQALVEEMNEANLGQPLLDFQHIHLPATGDDAQSVRNTAEELVRRAAEGEDFAALARRYSQSANASSGGLVQQVGLSDLDEPYRVALTALEEGQISPVVETRTGFHLFRLIRRLQPEPTPHDQLEISARQRLQWEAANNAVNDLLNELRLDSPLSVDNTPWQIGEWTVDQATIDRILTPNATTEQRDRLLGTFLLALEAQNRGMETPQVEKALMQQTDARLLQEELNRRRLAADAAIPDDVMRPFYDAQPSLFATDTTYEINLAFVPQGSDSYTTQQSLLETVKQLRAGASFEQFVSDQSVGPNRDNGGLIGPVQAGDLNRLGTLIWHAASALDEGAISEPIYLTNKILSQDPMLLRGGFAIIRLNQRQAAQTQSFEQAREAVRRAYAEQHRHRLDTELVNRILDDNGFEIVRLPDLEELRQ